jgi:hypothetical protein
MLTESVPAARSIFCNLIVAVEHTLLGSLDQLIW